MATGYNKTNIRTGEPLFDLENVVGQLAAVRQEWRAAQQRSNEPGGRELPSRDALADILRGLKGVLFPMRLGPTDLRQESEDFYVGHTLGAVLHALHAQVRLELHYTARHQDAVDNAGLDAQALTITRDFAGALPGIRRLLDSDVVAAFEGDPAARSVDEVLLCYPGILAMIFHRVAHRLYQSGVPLLARIAAELAHAETGIDIHPGATIGPGFFIDHGTGVVIGETAVIGERVRLYQAVTLGKQKRCNRRHRLRKSKFTAWCCAFSARAVQTLRQAHCAGPRATTDTAWRICRHRRSQWLRQKHPVALGCRA